MQNKSVTYNKGKQMTKHVDYHIVCDYDYVYIIIVNWIPTRPASLFSLKYQL